MDIKPALSEAAIRIRESLDRFASGKSWSRCDYYLSMDANLVWLYFQVDLYAKAFEPSVPDENARYDEVYDFLERDLQDESGLFEATSVILWTLSSRNIVKDLPLGENYVRIDESLLNPGWVEPQQMSQLTLRNEG